MQAMWSCWEATCCAGKQCVLPRLLHTHIPQPHHTTPQHTYASTHPHPPTHPLGVNLLEVMCHPDVDYTRTVSNDIIEMLQTLGIEAARNALLKELRGELMCGRRGALCDCVATRLCWVGRLPSWG